MILKFLKFSLVGLSGMIIDFMVTYLLKEKVQIHRYIANSVGFTMAVTNNYFLNRLWTFMSDNPHILFEYTSFVTIAVVGLAINNFFLYVFELFI